MFPYIPFFWLKIYTLWIWIVISIIVFLLVVRYYCKKYSLPYNVFFSKFYLFLLIPYVLSRYVSAWLWEGFYLPFSPDELFYVISPIDYKLHFVGLSWWIFIATFLFFRHIEKNRTKRLEVIFYWIWFWLIVAWIFLLLGESFVGRQANSAIAVSTSFKDSIVYDLDKVYPSGLIISVLSGVWLFIIKIFSQKKSRKTIILWFVGLIIIYNIVLYFTTYDKYLPKNVMWVVFDINTYSSLFLIIAIIIFWKLYNEQN